MLPSSNLSILVGKRTPLGNDRVPELLQKIVENNAVVDEIALIFEDGEQIRNVTYRELHRLSDRLANYIKKTVNKHGLAKNNDKFIIAVQMHPSESLIVTLLAIWKTGAAYLPLDPTYPAERVEYIMLETKPAMVMYDKEKGNYLDTFALCVKDCESIDNLKVDSESNSFEMPKNEDLAVVIYTSSRTGIPKGACLSHTMLLNRMEWQFRTFPFSSTEKVCVFKTVVTFVDSIFEIWGPLIKGRSLLILSKKTSLNPEKLVIAMDKYGVERVSVVPTMLRMILLYKTLSNDHSLLNRLTLWICTGEILSPSLAKEFYYKFEKGRTRLCNFYGGIEFLDVSYHVITGPKDLDGHENFPAGIPVDNDIIYIMDEHLNIVKEGDHGEIYAGGLSVLKNYMRPANQGRLIKNPYSNVPEFETIRKSDDIGYIKNGFLYYLHKSESIVEIHGKKINMLEVEHIINEIESVKRAVVLCYHSGQLHQSILAFTQTESTLTSKQIETDLALKLPDYMVPTVVLIDEFPLLINGKVDNQTLLKNHEENLKTRHVKFDYEGISQEHKEDAELFFKTVSSLSDGLFNDQISLNANFFDIGGDSLNAISTISTLRENGLHISIDDFVNAANFGEILNKLTSQDVTFDASSNYTRRFITESDKDVIFDIFKNSYYKKSEVDVYILDQITDADIDEFLETVWPSLLDHGVSFLILRKSTGEVVGMSINLDCERDFTYKVDSKLAIINDLFDEIEINSYNIIREKFGTVFFVNWLATVEWLSGQENVAVVHYIEQEVLKIAKERCFNVVMASNQSAVTMQLAENVFGYTRMLEYQLNQYVHKDNSRPFSQAPDSLLIYVNYKVI